MFNRAEIVDKNFTRRLNSNDFPQSRINVKYNDLGFNKKKIIQIFESQISSRHIDLKARIMKEAGDCFYTIGSSGHEGNAVFGHIFPYTDMAFLHYRSGPFFIERSRQINNSTPIYDLALSFVASSEDPISGGRHKVFGSKLLNIPPQTSTIASHLPKAVGTAYSIDRGLNLGLKENNLNPNSIILCSFGDASANHASALSAINTACWIKDKGGHVPIIFICEDNGTGISVKTEEHWIEQNFSNKAGLNYIKTDGLNIFDLILQTYKAEKISRIKREPVFLHMKTVRLMGHAGSDVESGYKDLKQIEEIEFNDPLLHTAKLLIENRILSKNDILDIYEESRNQIKHVFNYSISRPKLKTAMEVMSSIIQNKKSNPIPEKPKEEVRVKIFGKEYSRIKTPQHMAKLINYALYDILIRYSNTVIFGEDVAVKGGVYNVTSDLHKKFGVRRVFDSPLDETSIIGFAIGFGHNGFIPIPEIQFLAYFHNAEDQLRGEAATLPFFSKGQFTNPIILRIPGLAYQKGFGGHFHNDNSLTIFRDIPGVILAVPSNGSDAVKMLRTSVKEAVKNGRIVVFIEPIALYMTKDLYKPKDKKWTFKYPEPDEEIPLGNLKSYGEGNCLTIISYGNGLYLSLQAQKLIEEKLNKKIKVIDLRWLSDINYSVLIDEISTCTKILIVDECRRKGSYGEGMFYELYKRINRDVKIKLHAAKNSFIPLGESATVTLPSKDSIFKIAIKFINE